MLEQPAKVDLATPDLAAEKRAGFEELFPGVIADGVLDAHRLGELLDIGVTAPAGGRERFGLMWAGKQDAIRSLLRPSRGTLEPDFDASVDFDSAQNAFIVGDNLEVLKLLQKAYNDQVKLVYIDPPYNTGNDFVYNDDFADGLSGYLEFTGQINADGKRVTTNADFEGRRHSRWLSMMYPRLMLARNLLSQNGVLAVSIDSNEVGQLKLVLDEVFGQENYLNTFVWVSNLKGRQISNGGAVGTHEYILLYGRNAANVSQFRGSFSELKELMPSVYKGGDYEIKHDTKGPYVTKNELYNTNSKFNETTAPTMVFRIHFSPESGEVRVTDIDDDTSFPGFISTLPHANARPGLRWHAWRWSRARILEESEDLEFKVTGDRLRIWTKVRDVEGVALKDLIIGPSTLTGQSDLRELGLDRIFDNPKPVSLLQVLVAATTENTDLVLDFFAGSGATAHAVAVQNEKDGGRRRCVTVNIPEPTPPNSEAARKGLPTVSDITRVRLGKVLATIPNARALGLRSFRLARSSFRSGSAAFSQELFDLHESTLLDSQVDLEIVAAEVLLREGVRLDVKWRRREAEEATVIVAGEVAIVLSLDINDAVVAEALDLEPRVLVFLEDGFAGKDAVKANAFIRARNLGITMKTV